VLTSEIHSHPPPDNWKIFGFIMIVTTKSRLQWENRIYILHTEVSAITHFEDKCVLFIHIATGEADSLEKRSSHTISQFCVAEEENSSILPQKNETSLAREKTAQFDALQHDGAIYKFSDSDGDNDINTFKDGVMIEKNRNEFQDVQKIDSELEDTPGLAGEGQYSKKDFLFGKELDFTSEPRTASVMTLTFHHVGPTDEDALLMHRCLLRW
ncbi:uncharacterized protein LOC111088129, partial [Limulus polyphemus]|uniref:Uncharacterized protein LOC111088129 n=1 Tax=Limulus polyphemus TaxID=6850 RepID=A0ABM1TAI1_LIMPO